MRIDVLPAQNGDCILVEYTPNKYILVDGGYVDTYRNHLLPKLKSIAEADGVVDVIVVTHIDSDHISGYIQIDCRCVPNVHCTNFWNEIACDYLRCLERQKRLGDYTVPRKQLMNVLSSMGLNEDYAVIATERIEELPKSAVLLHALRRVKWFFVVRKGQVPYIKLIPVDDLKPVRDGGKICSNIEEFQGCREPVFGLSLATKVSFSIPQDFVGYVRFTIDDTYEAQNAKINPKQTFDELFGKEENENDGPLS